MRWNNQLGPPGPPTRGMNCSKSGQMDREYRAVHGQSTAAAIAPLSPAQPRAAIVSDLSHRSAYGIGARARRSMRSHRASMAASDTYTFAVILRC